MGGKKDKAKIEFTVHIQTLRELPKTSVGNEIFIDAKRAKKDEDRSSKTYKAASTSVQIDERFKWVCSMTLNEKTKQYEPKEEITFVVKEMVPKKKATVVGKAVLGLNSFAESGTIRMEVLNLEPEKKSKDKPSRLPNLVVKVSSVWPDKAGGTAITPTPSAAKEDEKKEKEKDKKEKKSPKPVEEEPEPPTASSVSEPDYSENERSEESEEEVRKPSKSNDSKRASHDTKTKSTPTKEKDDYSSRGSASKTKKRRDSVDSADREDTAPEEYSDSEDDRKKKQSSKGSNSSKASSVPSNQSNVDKEAFEAEIADLKTDKSRLEKRVERLQKENEELREKLEESGNNTRSSRGAKGGNAEEVDDLKRDKQRLEKKVERLQKELEDLHESSSRAIEEAKRSSEASSKYSDKNKTSSKEDDKKSKFSFGKGKDEASTVKTLEYQLRSATKEQQEQQKELDDLSRRLDQASSLNDDLLSTILEGIKQNSTEGQTDDVVALSYWLSFTANLFKMMKSELPNSIKFDRDALEDPALEEELSGMSQIDRFFHELILTGFSIHGLLVHNFSKQMDNVLVSSILDQSTSNKNEVVSTEFPQSINGIIQSLSKCSIHESIIRQVIEQLFRFIDAQLFNTLLKRPNLYTCSYGFHIKMLLSKVESALGKISKQLFAAGDQLHYIKEAANLLVMDKSIVSDETTRNQIFTHLNIVQINHIIKNFKPDEYAPEPVPDSLKRNLDEACSLRRSLVLQLDTSDIKKTNLFAAL